MLFKCQRANAYRDSIAVLRIAVKEIRRNYAFDVPSHVIGWRPPLEHQFWRHTMKRTIVVATILILLLTLAGSQSTTSNLISPHILATGKFVGQTSPFTKTVFTPTRTGLY